MFATLRSRVKKVTLWPLLFVHFVRSGDEVNEIGSGTLRGAHLSRHASN